MFGYDSSQHHEFFCVNSKNLHPFVQGRLLPQYDPTQFNMASRPGSSDHNFEQMNKQMYANTEEPNQSHYDDGEGGMQCDDDNGVIS